MCGRNSRSLNRLPTPSSLVTLISPPITPARRRHIVRPSPVPGSADTCPQALERQEDTLEIVARNARAAVLDEEFSDLVTIRDRQGDRAALGEFDGVRQQVDQQLTQPLLVRGSGDRKIARRCEIESDALAVGLNAEHIDDLREEGADRDLVAGKIEFSPPRSSKCRAARRSGPPNGWHCAASRRSGPATSAPDPCRVRAVGHIP